MEQQRAINALESYILLSKDAKSPRAAADLVVRATSDPNTYIFAELLHTPNIHALQQSDEYASHYKVLEIFAWGTWTDYHHGKCCRITHLRLQCFQQLTNLSSNAIPPKAFPPARAEAPSTLSSPNSPPTVEPHLLFSTKRPLSRLASSSRIAHHHGHLLVHHNGHHRPGPQSHQHHLCCPFA